MNITVCDQCHERVEETRIVCKGVAVIIDRKLECQIDEHDFCSLHCQQAYIIARLKEKGIGDNIKV